MLDPCAKELARSRCVMPGLFATYCVGVANHGKLALGSCHGHIEASAVMQKPNLLLVITAHEAQDHHVFLTTLHAVDRAHLYARVIHSADVLA